MNFNIYLDDETARRLTAVSQTRHQPRNALIRQAVREWLSRHDEHRWPEEVLAFEGLDDMPAFEANRDRLIAPLTDPFA